MKTAVACAFGLCLTALFLAKPPESADDFRAFYRGAQLVATSAGVYSQPTLSPAAAGGAEFLPYIRIPSYALLLKPLTVLPYRTARAIWITLIVLAFAALIALSPRPRDQLAIALCFSVPAAFTVILGQDIAFVVVIALIAGRLSRSGNEFLAGIGASLLAIKPVYLLPAGLVFLARSRRGMLGIVLGTAVQLAVSFALEGPRWPFAYFAQLRNPLFDPEPRRMVNMRGVLASLSLPNELFVVLTVVAAIALLVWLWASARKLPLSDALLIALPIGMIASPHAYIYDAVVLIPLLVRVASLESFGGTVMSLALTPLPYLALMAQQGSRFVGSSVLLAGSALVVTATLIAVAHITDTVPRAPRIPSVLPGEIVHRAS